MVKTKSAVVTLTKSEFYLSRILSFCGIIAGPIFIVITVVAGLLTPGYNNLTDAISILSEQGAKSPGLMISGFIILGVLTIGFAQALHLRLRVGTRAVTGWCATTFCGICTILAGIFRNNPIGNKNIEDILHNSAVITGCICIFIGMWMFASIMPKKSSWFSFTRFTLAVSVLAAVLSIVFLIGSHVPFAGLFQRFFYGVIIIWIEVVSIWLFRSSKYVIKNGQ